MEALWTVDQALLWGHFLDYGAVEAASRRVPADERLSWLWVREPVFFARNDYEAAPQTFGAVTVEEQLIDALGSGRIRAYLRREQLDRTLFWHVKLSFSVDGPVSFYNLGMSGCPISPDLDSADVQACFAPAAGQVTDIEEPETEVAHEQHQQNRSQAALPARISGRSGRRPFPWMPVRDFVFDKLWDHGGLGHPDLFDQAALERLTIAEAARHFGREPAESTVRGYVARWLAEFEAEKARK